MTTPSNVTVFIATSLDGFIARKDGSLDWLPTPTEDPSGEDYGYAALMRSVDALVMGRNTFEKVLTFGEWPYGNKPVIVLTRRPLVVPPALSNTVQSMKGSPSEILIRLAELGWHQLYVDGGITIQHFLREGLVRRIILTRVPVLLGDGIPLFGPMATDVQLKHIQTRQFVSGLVQSDYEVIA